jgi:ABC-type molybdate transport system substrate-binding protein
VACLVAAILIALPAASAAELQVLVSIAMRGAVAEVAATFEKQTGHTVKIIAAAPSQIVASLKDGAPADVVVQIDSALPEMEDKGLVRRGRVALGTTGFAIATRSGDPASDIATADALKAVLLGAAKVIYNDRPSRLPASSCSRSQSDSALPSRSRPSRKLWPPAPTLTRLPRPQATAR